jgi:hypothetical protein
VQATVPGQTDTVAPWRISPASFGFCAEHADEPCRGHSTRLGAERRFGAPQTLIAVKPAPLLGFREVPIWQAGPPIAMLVKKGSLHARSSIR